MCLSGKEPTCQVGGTNSIPGSGDPLEEEIANRSSIFERIIPWTEKLDGLQSMGVTKSQRQLSN